MVSYFFNIFCFYRLESLTDYLKQDDHEQYFCDADVIVRNRSDFDPKTICGENSFLPFINSMEHIRHLSLILQSLDHELKYYNDCQRARSFIHLLLETQVLSIES